MNYTKGEWKADKNCSNNGLYRIFSRVGESYYLVADILPRRETEANANLIAAAPDMYEALKDIAEQVEKSLLPLGADLADSIRVFGKQALAKAEGKEV